MVPMTGSVVNSKEASTMTSEERWAYETGIEWSSDPRSLQELLPSAKSIMKGSKLIKMFETGWKVGKGKVTPLPDLEPAVVVPAPAVYARNPQNPASPIGTQTRISVDFDVPAEKWWKAAMAQAFRAPQSVKRLLTVRGPHTVLVSDTEANAAWNWASAIPGWQGSKASHPYPLKFESYAR